MYGICSTNTKYNMNNYTWVANKQQLLHIGDTNVLIEKEQ